MKMQGGLLLLLAGFFVQPTLTQYNWDSWRNWSNCSVTCGTGTQKRFRLSTGPGLAASMGIKVVQTKSCRSQNCTGWSQWVRSPCSVTCGEGSHMKHRVCLGEYCDNEMRGSGQNETETCRRRKCQDESTLPHMEIGKRLKGVTSPLQQLINFIINYRPQAS